MSADDILQRALFEHRQAKGLAVAAAARARPCPHCHVAPGEDCYDKYNDSSTPMHARRYKEPKVKKAATS